MGVSLISPILPELRDAFSISDSQVGLVITAFSFPGIFLTPIIGLLADRIGRKRVLVPLLLLFGASGSGIAFTTDFGILLVLRVLQGIGATAIIMLAITLIGDIYEGEQRDVLIGVNASMIGIGAAFFPMIGGALALLAWNVPFLFYSVGLLVGFLALMVIQEPISNDTVNDGRYFNRIVSAIRRPRAIALFGATFVGVFIFYGAVITAVPLLLSDEYGLSPALIGPVIAVVSLTNAVTASQHGRIARIRSGPELVSLGFIFLGLGLILIGVAPSILVILFAMCIFGIGVGLVFPSIDAIIMSDFSEDLRAGIMGVRTSMLRIGQTVGPIGFTGAAEAFFISTIQGYYVILIVSGSIVIVSGAVIYIIMRK